MHLRLLIFGFHVTRSQRGSKNCAGRRSREWRKSQHGILSSLLTYAQKVSGLPSLFSINMGNFHRNITQMLQAKGETIHRVTVAPTNDESILKEEPAIERLPLNEGIINTS